MKISHKEFGEALDELIEEGLVEGRVDENGEEVVKLSDFGAYLGNSKLFEVYVLGGPDTRKELKAQYESTKWKIEK